MRLVRSLVRALFLILILIAGAGGAAVAASQTAWFREWLRGVIIEQSTQYLNGDLTIGRLDGNLFSGVVLGDVGLSMGGQPVVSLHDVVLRYNAWQIISRGLSLDELRISRPHIILRSRDDGWQIAGLIKRQAQEADRQGPTRPFGVERIVIDDGTVDIENPAAGGSVPARVDGLSLVGSFQYEPVRYSTAIESLSFHTTTPSLEVASFSGRFAVKGDAVAIDNAVLRTSETTVTLDGVVKQYLTTPILDVRVSSPHLSIPEVARFVPAAAGIDLRPTIDARVEGTFDALKVEATSASTAGSLKASLRVDAAAPGQAVSGDLSVQHLDVAQLLQGVARSDITADAKVDLSVDSLAERRTAIGSLTTNARVVMGNYVADRVDLHANVAKGRAELEAKLFAYGASASATGVVSWPRDAAPIGFDLEGVVQHVNGRALPRSLSVPSVETDINARYHVVGTRPSPEHDAREPMPWTATVVFLPSVLPGVRIDDGSSARLDSHGRDLRYHTDLSVHDLDLEQIGRAFGVPALAHQRYRSAIDGRVTADGRGTDVATLDVDASGHLTRAELGGGRVGDVAFDVALHQDEARGTATGRFAGVDPAALGANDGAKGRIDGEFSMNASALGVSRGLSMDTVSGEVRATLGPSVVGALAIDGASLDASYRQQIATVEALKVTGRDVNLIASGALALGDAGESSLAFHADSPRLSEVGHVVDLPLSGIARVEGTIGGNRQALTVTGTLEGDGLRYQENGALSLRSTFDAAIPELAVARASVRAESRATFVTLAGQNINELNATTRYDQSVVGFELTARQPERQLDAAGAVTLHPDHQEVHLDRLALVASNQRWQVPEGKRPTINYGGAALAIEDLRLVSGDQEIVAAGRWGLPGDALKVELKNVDLAGVDALLLRPPQFSGRLAASGEVTGTSAAPELKADFTVTRGGFRQFAYDSFAGHVDYSAATLVLDSRLQQTDSQWITAKGRVPTTLFRLDSGPSADEGGTGHEHRSAASEQDRVDLRIDSSPLGLGLVQGFTTAVTDVTGSIEAHLQVTGSASDPHPQGTITVANGTMTVPATGVAYTNLAGTIDLQPERVHIDSVVILDNHQSAMTLSGDLAVHRGQVGNVELWLNAEDFKVVDNKIGNVRVRTAIGIAGELRAPVIEGDFSVDTGRVDLDELIALTAASPYSTTPIQYGGGEPAAAAPATQPRTSWFDALRMNLRIQVPDDLVVKASNLQAPGASVGLGALNVTLGGDLTATKTPRQSVRLIGQVNTVRGTYDFQGRRFDILRDGTVRFDGSERLTPILDLRTRREIQGVEALVTVRGSVDRPEIVLSSSPPLDEADILSLIVFNQPINQLGEGQQASLSARAQQLAVGAVAGQVSQSIGDALNIDTFEISVGQENSTSAELTIGQQLGKDLYLKVQQGVGATTSTNVIIEYAISQWLRLQTNVLQGTSSAQSVFRRQQGSGADLIVLFTR